METQAALDALYLERAVELARRGAGGTSPNPPVGAVVVADGVIAGEGYHHRAGEPHAEPLALRAAGERARGATLYVSLEPCNHHGRTPPCSHAVAESGIARVVIGTPDPNPRTAGGGIAYLRGCGIAVDVIDDAAAREIIAPFARAVTAKRPFVTLKMAMSLDGFVASRRGEQQWLTGAAARTFVRELRIVHDAVAVGAGTVRIDDPQLTVRPPHIRERNYVRVVFSKSGSVDPASRILQPFAHYDPTIVLRGGDLHASLHELHRRGISSLLCEGGPELAAQLLHARLVDRLIVLVAPTFLAGPDAVPVVAEMHPGAIDGGYIDSAERLEDDLVITATLQDV